MTAAPTDTRELFNQFSCCVIMPTYNNAGTLKRVVDGVLKYTKNLIVVNDGSTDDTRTILGGYSQVEQVHFKENQGKGMALRTGFQKALELGFHYAISIDSDGQHFPEDLLAFLEELRNRDPNEEILLIGARNMDQPGVPKKSSFGGRFSNFWFWFETGIRMPDTQSGYRLYPVNALKNMKFLTSRFEFEIEVIVRAAWEGIKVRPVPVKVLYDESERVSHFRPWTDFMRISVLNTCLVLIMLFYIKPRNLLQRLMKKGWKRFVREDLLEADDPPRIKALSVALGVFVGLTPLWGLHTMITLGVAILFRLNKALAFAASNISIPPMIPFIVIASLFIGNFLLGQEVPLTIPDDLSQVKMLSHLKVYVVGSFVLAAISATLAALLTYAFLNRRSLQA